MHRLFTRLILNLITLFARPLYYRGPLCDWILGPSPPAIWQGQLARNDGSHLHDGIDGFVECNGLIEWAKTIYEELQGICLFITFDGCVWSLLPRVHRADPNRIHLMMLSLSLVVALLIPHSGFFLPLFLTSACIFKPYRYPLFVLQAVCVVWYGRLSPNLIYGFCGGAAHIHWVGMRVLRESVLCRGPGHEIVIKFTGLHWVYGFPSGSLETDGLSSCKSQGIKWYTPTTVILT